MDIMNMILSVVGKSITQEEADNLMGTLKRAESRGEFMEALIADCKALAE